VRSRGGAWDARVRDAQALGARRARAAEFRWKTSAADARSRRFAADATVSGVRHGGGLADSRTRVLAPMDARVRKSLDGPMSNLAPPGDLDCSSSGSGRSSEPKQGERRLSYWQPLSTPGKKSDETKDAGTPATEAARAGRSSTRGSGRPPIPWCATCLKAGGTDGRRRQALRCCSPSGESAERPTIAPKHSRRQDAQDFLTAQPTLAAIFSDSRRTQGRWSKCA